MPPRDQECPFAKELPGLVLGELAAKFRREVVRHVAACGSCREDLVSLRRLMSEMMPALPVAEESLTLRILASLRREGLVRDWLGSRAGFILCGVAVAAFIVCMLAVPAMRRPASAALSGDDRPSPAEVVANGCDWLLSVQEPEGSWSASRSGGQEMFDVGVTGLAIQALIASGHRDPATMKALERATNWLVAVQDGRGGFGSSDPTSLYNDGSAAVAFGRVLEAFGFSSLQMPFDRAILRLLAAQDASGGWGRLDASTGRPTPGISAWPYEALKLARGLGRDDVAKALARAETWIQNEGGNEGTSTRASLGDQREGGRVYATSRRVLAAAEHLKSIQSWRNSMRGH